MTTEEAGVGRAGVGKVSRRRVEQASDLRPGTAEGIAGGPWFRLSPYPGPDRPGQSHKGATDNEVPGPRAETQLRS